MSSFSADFLSKYGQGSSHEKRLAYGTAGFRENAVSFPLHSVFARMGVLAVLRSRCLKSDRAVGVMITASHNPEFDNGIKLVDGDGGMLNQLWEPYAERLANAIDFGVAVSELEQELGLTATAAEAGGGGGERGVVYVGRDTRPHSAELSECVKEGVEAYGGVVVDLGQVTTPQLHFAVKEQDHGEYRESRYFETLSSGYLALRDGAGSSGSDSVVVDGANGIGALAVVRMGEVIGREHLLLEVRNAVGDGPVNEGCGAEIVQKGQVPPCGVDASSDANKLLCSLDGDADRIVFHSFLGKGTGAGSNSDQAENKWILLDGDKIGCLMSVVLKQELVAAQLEGTFSLGVVQTAYANGASGAYLRSQGVPIAMAKTGVKYLHHVAHQFDLGAYFEANGHGTVLFSDAFLAYLKENNGRSADTPDRVALALRRLDAFTKAINQAVGDAISDMLVVLACLRILDMNLLAWHAMYTDLPSKQLKIPVSNKSLITCTEDETAALTPPSLPIALQEAMSTTPLGRCFVRPSGTEDVVRIYAEAETQEAADALAAAAVLAVQTSLSSSDDPILSRQHS